MEESVREKLLVVESDEALRTAVVGLLRNAGYEVATDTGDGMNSVFAFSPDAVILGANPPQLDCCDLLSEIKGSERTQNIRVIMLSPGGSAERTRALDLGADDVLSLPFDPHELLSRVRQQLRGRHHLEELGQKTSTVEENRNVAQQVLAAVNEERQTFRRGGMLGIAALLVAAILFLGFYHRTQQQNSRVYAAITRLQTGMLTPEKLLDRSRRALEDVGRSPSPPGDSEKAQLQKQSQNLRSQLATKNADDSSALQTQLSVVEERLQRLENEGKVAQTIIQSYEPSVCLLHVVVAFRDRATGLKLHYVGITSTGEPLTDEHH